MDNLTYEESLGKLKLPTLEYCRLRGDMIKVFNILRGFMILKLRLILVIVV